MIHRVGSGSLTRFRKTSSLLRNLTRVHRIALHIEEARHGEGSVIV